MLAEFDWDHLDDLVSTYASAYVHGDTVPELERKIVEACSSATSAPPTFDDFTSLVDTTMRSKDIVSRKIAWISQHAFGARAWSVGQKILLRKPRLTSPLIDQVRALGIEAMPLDLQRCDDVARQNFEVQTKIDALLLDMANNTIFVVKGCSYSQAMKQSNGRLVLNTGQPSLFTPSDRLLGNVCVARSAVSALILAHLVLKSAFNHMEIRPVFMVVDDVDCGWHHQAFDLAPAFMAKLDADAVQLDEYDAVASSLDLQGLRGDSDALAPLPQWKTADFLAIAPVDRPTRCLMLLTALWRRQRGSGRELVPVPATALAEAVSERYGLVYPVDLRRHDLEDCLRAGGFIRRVRYAENSYAITPTGVGRIYLMKRKFYARANPDLGAHALRSIRVQAQRWARYQGGQAS